MFCCLVWKQFVEIVLSANLLWVNSLWTSSFTRTAVHIFVLPVDVPMTITQYVTSIQKEFNACQTILSMYLSTFIVSEL